MCARVCVRVWGAQVRSLKLEQEVEKNKILSEALQTLAAEHHELEQSVVKGSSPRSPLSEDEFHDAVSGELTSYQTRSGVGGGSVTSSHSLLCRSPIGHWNTFSRWSMFFVGLLLLIHDVSWTVAWLCWKRLWKFFVMMQKTCMM